MIKLNIKRFASGTITLSLQHPSSSVTFQGKVEWSSVANTTNNTSTVTAKLYARKQGSSTATSGTKWSGYVTIDGTQNNYSTGSLSIKNGWVLVYTAPTKTVTHSSDGSKSITIAGSVKGPSGTTLANITSSGSDTATMDRIYRQSSLSSLAINISTSNGSTTATVTPQGTKYISTYYDTLYITCGGYTLNFASITFGSAITLTSAQKTTLWNMFGTKTTISVSAYVTSKTSPSGSVVGNSATISSTATLPTYSLISSTFSTVDSVTTYDHYKVHSTDLISGLSIPVATFAAASSNGELYGRTLSYNLYITNPGETIYIDNPWEENIVSPYTLDSAINSNQIYTIIATDGRKTVTVGTFTADVPHYTKPKLFGTLRRDTPTSTTIHFIGRMGWHDGTGFTNLESDKVPTFIYTINGVSRTISPVVFQYDAPSTVFEHYNDYRVQCDITIGALEYKYPIELRMYVDDLINYRSTESTTSVPPGKPLWHGYVDETNAYRQHMVVDGELDIEGGLSVESDARFHSKAMFTRAPRYGTMGVAQDNEGLPDGDLTSNLYWQSVPNGAYYFNYNFGTYTHQPADYGWVEKYGTYDETETGNTGNFNVIFYTGATGPVYRISGNSSTTTGSWYRIDGGTTAMSLGLSSNQTISQTGSVKINLSSASTTGTGLTASSNGIKIGAGIHYVEVSAAVEFSAVGGTNALRRIFISKNGSSNVGQACMRPVGTYESVVIPPRIISVAQNDVLYLYLNSDNASQTIYGQAAQTYLTVKVVS